MHEHPEGRWVKLNLTECLATLGHRGNRPDHANRDRAR
jgi:hypothetical protein